jgi:hypothetical protein
MLAGLLMSSPDYEIQILGRWWRRCSPPIAAEVCGKEVDAGVLARQDVACG